MTSVSSVSSLSSLQPNVTLKEDYLPNDLLEELRENFLGSGHDQIHWKSDAETKVKIQGRLISIPRKQAVYSKHPNLKYRFTGISLAADDESLCPSIEKLRKYLENETKLDFNFVLVNYYQDGSKYIGYHRDDEKDLIKNHTIACISIGQERRFQMRYVQDRTIIQTYNLKDNSILLINPGVNAEWEHAIAKETSKSKQYLPRVSFTFRQFVYPQKK